MGWLHVIRSGKGFYLNGINRLDVDTFLGEVLNKHEIKDKAFKNLCGILKQTFSYACDTDYISDSPYRIKVNKKKIIKNPKNKLDQSSEVFLPEEQQRISYENVQTTSHSSQKYT